MLRVRRILMREVKLSLGQYRGKWYARGHDAFGAPVRSSLGLNVSSPDTDAARELGLLEARIRSNGGHKLGGARGTAIVVDDLIELYLGRKVADGELVKVKTVGDYWGRIPVSSVNDSSLMAWERVMIAKGLSASTIKRYCTVLKAIVNYGCKAKELPRIMLTTIGMDGPARVLNICNEDRDNIINCMEPDEVWYFTALAFTGARPKELINIRWRDVNMKRRLLTLRSYKGKHGAVMARTIPFSASVEKVLNELMSLFGCKKDDYVFRMADGKAWAEFKDSTKAVGYRLYRAAKAAGYEVGVENGITLYAFRHTFGTSAGNSGDVNPMSLSVYLGHKNVQTTKDNYFHGGVNDAEMLVQGLG
jgi:integrase